MKKDTLKSACSVSHHSSPPLLFLPPASEAWGKVLFSVCQFTPRPGGGGYPIWLTVGGGLSHPRSGFGGGARSQVQTGGGVYPIPGLAGGEGTPSSGLDGGIPSCWWGGTPFNIKMGGYPHPGLDGVPPHPRLDGVPPTSKAGWSNPPPSSEDRSAQRALAMWRAVCLLRSRRRTFLW